MKKILLFLSTIFLLNGCAESLALLGSGASNGRLVQSSLNSAISFGVKKQTGKTPLEHAIAYAEEKNPERKKETCISSFEITPLVGKKIIRFSFNKTFLIIKAAPTNSSSGCAAINKIFFINHSRFFSNY